jgi:hypothetical protein
VRGVRRDGTLQTLRGQAHASCDGSTVRPRQSRWKDRTQKLQQMRRPLLSPHSVQSSSFSSSGCSSLSVAAAVAGACEILPPPVSPTGFNSQATWFGIK